MNLFLRLVREVKNIAHLVLAFVAIKKYGNPSKRLHIIGVTGTDGKTTTANYIYQLLQFSGKRVALISTVGVFLNGEREALGFHVTTPSPFVINKYLKEALRKNIEYVILEVSSHALDQHRVSGINFEIGVMTNLTREHLDYHKSMERYLSAKLKLLKSAKKAILNINDYYYKKVVKVIGTEKVKTYSLLNTVSDLAYGSIQNRTFDKLASFNKNNIMAAILTLDELGISRDKYFSKVSELSLPEGRLQYLQKSPFQVIIDFAHTPNAFMVLLPEFSGTAGRIIHVFGSAGERDRKKRSDMGYASSRFADVIILTSEDPRSEKVSEINHAIKKGIAQIFKRVSVEEFKNIDGKFVLEIEDRRKAIEFALKIAKKNDVVLITGKGPEESMNMGSGEVLWSDIKVTKELL